MAPEEETTYFQIFGLTFPWRRNAYLRLLWKVYLAMLVVLLVSIYLFQYEMTDADVPGGLVFGALLTYLILLIRD